MKIGIVGHGHVGTAMKQLFTEAIVYDEPKSIGTREAINACDLAFVCVPTPQKSDGGCDTSIVESVLNWIEAKVIVLRSTVTVGFTDEMSNKLRKRICFQPEYYGETVAHPFAEIKNQGWITVGGDKDIAKQVVSAYQTVLTSDVVINIVDAKTAELAKYMENCFLATKVTFCNEFYDLACKIGVDYNELRETWLLDPRIGRSHTFVYPENRGFGGACLPKDLSALISIGQSLGADVSMMQAVMRKNSLLKGKQTSK